MQLTQITDITDFWFPSVYTLYESAFPKNERRNKENFVRILQTNKMFHCYVILHNQQFIGFITTWHFSNFIYIEHFAIMPEQRNKNFGGQVLDLFTQQNQNPIVLEVELPSTSLSQRRIRFYEKHNFSIIKTDYQQPPYRKNETCTPMYLMCTCKKFSDIQISIFQKAVYPTFF